MSLLLLGIAIYLNFQTGQNVNKLFGWTYDADASCFKKVDEDEKVRHFYPPLYPTLSGVVSLPGHVLP